MEIEIILYVYKIVYIIYIKIYVPGDEQSQLWTDVHQQSSIYNIIMERKILFLTIYLYQNHIS